MKKVTSLVVALLMLISMCSLCASAAVNDAVMALRVAPKDGSTFNPGDVVTFEVSYEATSDLAGLGICTVTVGYDSDVFEPIETITPAGTLLNAASTVIFTGYGLDGKVSLGNSFVQAKGNLTAADTAKGWDSALKIAMTKEVGSTLFECYSETKVFAFQLKIKDSAPGGNAVVGITDGSIQDETTFVDEELGAIAGPSGEAYGFSTSKIFDLGDASVTVAGGVTPPPAGDPITVENISTQVQWQSKDEGLMRVAFRGNIKNYTLNLVDGSDKEIADIAEMGVVYSKSNTNPTVGGADCTAAPAWTIYDFTTGGYFFRAVVGNYPYDNAETLYANAYIIIDGQTITASNGATSTSGAAEYARATALGMATK